ncbi:aldose 1-epimerase family protein [Ningiella sp. W23]|uniref:aldose 1-epimerase family protein n=1 Tax=Ningiella sp. W23 TaxID=3023715 RepID=UPI003756A134
MAQLFGKNIDAKALAQRAGSLDQFASVKLCTFENGWERGMRYLAFRNAGGLSFNVLVDRAMDLGEAYFNDAPIGWHSPTGTKHPMYHEHEAENGLGWLRSFSGLMMTCGLDHILGPETENTEYYNYPHQSSRQSPVHGRLAFSPSNLSGYGAKWEGEDYILWCEGSVQQTSVFGENLMLTRRIECKMGSNQISISDTVINLGFIATPHMLMYHINLGYPVLDEGSQYLAPIKECLWMGHEAKAQNLGYRTQREPLALAQEQVYEHRVMADKNGKVPVALVNPTFNQKQGLGVLVEYEQSNLPCLFQWQCLQEGLYAFGIEPSTNHVLGKHFAKTSGALTYLQHQQEQHYCVKIEVLANQQEIEECRKRINAIYTAPCEEFLHASENWFLGKSYE